MRRQAALPDPGRALDEGEHRVATQPVLHQAVEQVELLVPVQQGVPAPRAKRRGGGILRHDGTLGDESGQRARPHGVDRRATGDGRATPP
jgi:hypothetical protein